MGRVRLAVLAVAAGVLLLAAVGGARDVTQAPSAPAPQVAAMAAPRALPPAVAPAKPHARKRPELPSGRSIKAALRRALLTRAIDRRHWARWHHDIARARAALEHLAGARRLELTAVVSTLDNLAATGQLSASRMPQGFLTLERNVRFWTTAPLPRPRVRMSFGRDPAILEYRPGHGLQYHPLANAGRAAALAAPCVRKATARASIGGPGVVPAPPQRLPKHCHQRKVRQALDRLLAMASKRGGFTAWEYEFRYGTGAPPWISAMAQATAAQALARGAAAFGEARYRAAALDALKAFELPPPLGVNDHGTLLMYSFDPGLHILNGFLQAVIGLHDVAQLTRDKRARRIYQGSERVARRSIADYDTGAWSLYSFKGREAPLNYERLVTRFLGRLCGRTDQPAYCSAERRFTRYLQEPPRIATITRGPRKARHREVTAYRISKVSTVTVTVRGHGRRLVRLTRHVRRGRYTFAWTPQRGGRYLVRIQATGLEGRTRAVRDSVAVKAPPKPRPKRKPRLSGELGHGNAGAPAAPDEQSWQSID